MFIPLRIRLLHNFGRSSFNIGFLFTVIGLAFIVYFSFQINWKILLAGKDDFTPAQAFISGYNETQYSVNDSFLFEYHYVYASGGENVSHGSFLEYAGAYNTGQEIQGFSSSTRPYEKHEGKDKSLWPAFRPGAP